MAGSWTNTRLAVILNGEVDKPISPIESFTANLALNTEVIHSLEATHIGYIANPDTFTWSANVRGVGSAAARLTRLALQGTEFQIGLYEADGSKGEWAFKQVLFNRCVITTTSPSGTVNGSPMVTFSGISLRVDVQDELGDMLLPPFTA